MADLFYIDVQEVSAQRLTKCAPTGIRMGRCPPAADLPRPRPQLPDVPPANEKQKTNQSLFGGPNVVAEDNNGQNFQTSAGDNFQAPGSTFSNGLATPQGRRFRVPKPYHKARNVRPSQGSIQGTPDSSLVAENSRLKEHVAMQTATIRALTILASRHDNVLSILTNKLGSENNLTGNYDDLSLEIEQSNGCRPAGDASRINHSYTPNSHYYYSEDGCLVPARNGVWV